jgi:hypothetical protein
MSQLTWLCLRVTDFVTLNRGMPSLLDPHVLAVSSPWCGVATQKVVIDRTLHLRALLFLPTETASAAGGVPLPVIVFFPWWRVCPLLCGVPALRLGLPTHHPHASAVVLSLWIAGRERAHSEEAWRLARMGT